MLVCRVQNSPSSRDADFKNLAVLFLGLSFPNLVVAHGFVHVMLAATLPGSVHVVLIALYVLPAPIFRLELTSTYLASVINASILRSAYL